MPAIVNAWRKSVFIPPSRIWEPLGFREPYCEYYVSQIAETMGLNAVHNDLENWKGITACLAYYDKLGPEFSKQIRSMLVFDALIYSGDVIAPVPIFDNGLSLFCYAGKEEYANLDEYVKTRSNPYNISYEEVCAEVMGPKQKEQLRRMIGFRFKRHESLNLPEEHLQAMAFLCCGYPQQKFSQ